ncbi:hypothetical protein C6502_01330 [Candidatus Poribacteria bacterium]|nr:MAG: hypothetical protein C6502_01330 [Candidatus Poribacteria bacterium]
MKAMCVIGITVILSMISAIGCDRVQDNVSPRLPFTTPSDAVIIDDSTNAWDSDEFVLQQAVITNDSLDVTVSYSGGCQDHIFNLVSSGMFLESDPVQMPLVLIHNANNDRCEAWITEDHSFDLTPIKELYQDAYHQSTGIINILLKDAGALTYQF